MTTAVTLALYISGWISLIMTTRKRLGANLFARIVIAFAVIMHVYLAYSTIHSPSGFKFGFFQVASLVAASMSALVYFSALRQPLFKLFLLLLPISLVTILCAQLIESEVAYDRPDLGLMSHILLSILAYSMLTIATLQAILLNYQTTQLKSHQAKSVMGIFPPLQTMESLLFDMVWAGVILLGLSIITGVIFIDDLLAQNLSHKTVFSIISWILYAILLYGRHVLGWRGKVAIRWIIAGFVMLMLAYFGSKFVLEFIL